MISYLDYSSRKASDLRRETVLIWDEVTLSHASKNTGINNILKDLTIVYLSFGGKVVLLGGDFCQCLPVI